MIEIEELVIGHGSCEILQPIQLRFHPGEFVAIVGANGAGKTTLLKTIAGILPAISGNISIDACRLAQLRAAERAQKLAFVDSETPVFGSMTVRDVVAMGRLPFRPWWQWTNEIDDNRAVDAALTACHLEAFVQRDFAMLSSGERQRVWIAAAFAQTTSHLLLDEPTSRLDIRYAIDVLRLLRIAATNGSTVIASMHDLERAALFADRIIILGEGRVIADGAPADVLTSAILYRAYGVTIDVRHEKGQVWLAAQVQ